MINSYQVIHETIIRDIIDIINDVKNFDQIEWINNRNNVGSIAKRANNLTLVFPVLCSTNININTAMIISKAIERKCSILLQILFSSIQLTDVDNLYDYLKLFHTNLNLKSGISLDDFINTVDGLANEGAIQVTDTEIFNSIKEDMRNINYTINTELNNTSINDYVIHKDIYNESNIICEAKSNDPVSDIIKDKMREREVNTKELDIQTKFFQAQLKQNDIQKINELVPTTMIVNFNTIKNGVNCNTNGIIGIKAKLYPINSMDIIDRIASKNKESNILFNFIKATTREISFLKDFLFALDKCKLDAINMARESNNAKMFKVLERRANTNKFLSLVKKNNASPITSLVISQEEVEYLKKYHNIDMDKSVITRTILEKYNLLDITIADEALEIARFLFDDGDGIYETLTFDSLEKEAKDSSYKKVVNLVSKINR